MPELEWAYGYPFALGVMFVIDLPAVLALVRGRARLDLHRRITAAGHPTIRAGTRPRRLQRDVVDVESRASIRRAWSRTSRPARPAVERRRAPTARPRRRPCARRADRGRRKPRRSRAARDRSRRSRDGPAPLPSARRSIWASRRQVERRIRSARTSDSIGSIGVQPVVLITAPATSAAIEPSSVRQHVKQRRCACLAIAMRATASTP